MEKLVKLILGLGLGVGAAWFGSVGAKQYQLYGTDGNLWLPALMGGSLALLSAALIWGAFAD